MKILLLTQWFQPEPLFKGMPFARAFRDRGHQVEVLTGFPNYPGGKVYPGYRIQAWQQTVIEGIKVNRVALYPSHDRSGFRRILNYFSFGLSSAALGPFLIEKPDVIYVYNLVTLGLTSSILRFFSDCPVVYDVQDLWPDSVANSGILENRFLLQALGRWCCTVYRHASHVVVLSPGMAAELVQRGVPRNRVSVVYNWCDEEHMRPMERDPSFALELGLSGSFIVMFAGTMGIMQGLDVVLKAAERLGRIESRIKFAFVGGGIERDHLRQTAKELRLANVVFLERQPPEAMGRILSLSDITLVHLKDNVLFRMTIPSKVQAYMAAGKPILLGVRGDAAGIVYAADCGKVVEPENEESIVGGVLELFAASEEERKRLGMNARRYYEDVLSMDTGVRRFEHIFEGLCDKRSPQHAVLA